MTQNFKQACVFGGTGFIGRQIVRKLAKLGYLVRVATRTPEKAYFLKTCGNVGQVVPFSCSYGDDKSLENALRGCDVVINCVGILYEKEKGGFVKTHQDLPGRLAKLCKKLGVKNFIHLSALGCEESQSQYGQSKKLGEKAIFENFSAASILRPSVVFGAEDNFFNMFAKLSIVLPCLPLIGGGKTKFQPVYVGDIADCVVACLKNDAAAGKVYELGGPDVLTFKQIYERLFSYTERKKKLVALPWSLAKVQGMVLGCFPSPLLTADQVLSLKTDNVVHAGALTMNDLGVLPTPMNTVLPTYLLRYRPGGRFGDKKRA